MGVERLAEVLSNSVILKNKKMAPLGKPDGAVFVSESDRNIQS
jgi:hypothetical protein